MSKRSLVWIAPTLAVALAFAYIAITPRAPDRPETKLTHAPASTTAPAHVDNVRRTREVRDSANAISSPAPETLATNCTVVMQYLANEDGTTTEVYTCKPLTPDAKHPYESYSNDALATLAYSDAKAAELLGMRLREDDEEAALSLIFRASALSGGDVEPILAYSNAYPHPSSVNEVSFRKTIHRKFVMSAVVELLGAERNKLAYWENRIRQASPDPEKEIELLRAQARRIVEEMRRIQLNVTGASSLGGQNDV